MTRHQKAFNKRLYELRGLPDTIFVETFMGCNLQCTMCPVPDPQKNMNGRKYSSISFSTFKSIIDQLSDKCRVIRLNQLGEPLLNTEIVDIIAYAASNGHHVGLTTNGTMLDASLGEKIILAGIREVVFSFDGCKKETYENIRVGACYDKVIANIDSFVQLNKVLNGKCHVRVDSIVSDVTYSEIEQTREFWKRRLIPINFIPIDDWAGKIKLPVKYGNRRSVSEVKTCRYPCHLLWSSMAISSEGRVMYCCHDYKLHSNLPTVQEKPLLEIWNSEIRDIRYKHVKGMIDSAPCLSCNAWMTMPEFYRPSRFSLCSLKSKLKSCIGYK